MKWLVLVAFASCGGAHAVGDVDTHLGAQPEGVARVCVVRPASESSGATMTLRDNDRLVGATRGRTYVCWLAAPGTHQVTSDDDDTGPTLFRAEAGARYFLHQEVFEVDGMAHAHLDWIDEATAREMIDSCDERVRVAVPGHDDHPNAQPVVPATRM